MVKENNTMAKKKNRIKIRFADEAELDTKENCKRKRKPDWKNSADITLRSKKSKFIDEPVIKQEKMDELEAPLLQDGLETNNIKIEIREEELETPKPFSRILFEESPPPSPAPRRSPRYTLLKEEGDPISDLRTVDPLSIKKRKQKKKNTRRMFPAPSGEESLLAVVKNRRRVLRSVNPLRNQSPVNSAASTQVYTAVKKPGQCDLYTNNGSNAMVWLRSSATSAASTLVHTAFEQSCQSDLPANNDPDVDPLSTPVPFLVEDPSKDQVQEQVAGCKDPEDTKPPIKSGPPNPASDLSGRPLTPNSTAAYKIEGTLWENPFCGAKLPADHGYSKRPAQQPINNVEITYMSTHLGSEDSSSETEDEFEPFSTKPYPREPRTDLDFPTPPQQPPPPLHTTDQASTTSDFDWQPLENLPKEGRRKQFDQEAGPAWTARGHRRSPLSYFTVIWNKTVVEHIVNETNLYAHMMHFDFNKSGKYPLLTWMPVSLPEIYIYFAILLATGSVIKNDIRAYWRNTNSVTATANFGKFMNLNRFLNISKVLHFRRKPLADVLQSPRQSVGKETEKVDTQINKVNPIVNLLNRQFQKLYVPKRDLTLECSPLRVKRDSRLRVYELCDSATGYLLNMAVHPVGAEIPKIVLQILARFEGRGHCVYMDKTFNSPALTRLLHTKGFDVVGTLDMTSHLVPPELTNLNCDNTAVGALHGASSRDVDILVWRDSTKIVSTVSTFHGAHVVDRGARSKPAVVHDYNEHMANAGKRRQVLSRFPIERKCSVSYKKVFRRLLNASVLNSYVLFHQLSGEKISYGEFRENLIDALLGRYAQEASEARREYAKLEQARRDDDVNQDPFDLDSEKEFWWNEQWRHYRVRSRKIGRSRQIIRSRQIL